MSGTPMREAAEDAAVESPTIISLLQTLSAATSRRGLLTGLGGGALAATFTARDHEADARKKRRKKRKNKKDKKDKNSPKVRVDATCRTLGNDISSITDGNVRVAQTFSALASGPLVKAEILANKEPGSEGDFVLRLSPVDASRVPTNEVLAETSVAAANVPDGISTFTFSFSNPVTVVAGTEYALVLTRPGGTFVAWVGQFFNPCDGQRFFSADQEKPFSPDESGFDLNFTTFVRS